MPSLRPQFALLPHLLADPEPPGLKQRTRPRPPWKLAGTEWVGRQGAGQYPCPPQLLRTSVVQAPGTARSDLPCLCHGRLGWGRRTKCRGAARSAGAPCGVCEYVRPGASSLGGPRHAFHKEHRVETPIALPTARDTHKGPCTRQLILIQIQEGFPQESPVPL